VENTQKLVYLDNSATTKISDEVFDSMLPFLKEQYGNPSSIYKLGRNAKTAIEKARIQVATAINATSNEIIFTSGGTEADNLAIKGVMQNAMKKGKNHIITTNFEHHAVLHVCQTLEKNGCEVTYLEVDSDGLITKEQVETAIKETTGLVTIMYANNEIGTIQPISDIGKICRNKGVIFHTDAVQALCNVEIDVIEQNIDLLSMSGHKIHAQKGVGALYIRKGINLLSQMEGGAQEIKKRSGTENVAGIVGFGVAIEKGTNSILQKQEKLLKFREKLITAVLQIPKSRLNGSLENRLCTNTNISFEAIEGEALLLMLDMIGICASSGSACTSGSLDPSHVLMAIGLPHEIAHGSLRLSFSDFTTEQDIDFVIKELPEIVEKLRKMSPLWK
jgi:cysteine desulfurase